MGWGPGLEPLDDIVPVEPEQDDDTQEPNDEDTA